MKHNLKLNTEDALVISQEIMERVVEKAMHEPTADELYQAKVEIHPMISNAMYKRELKSLENERFSTLIKLARALDDESMSKAINGLGYDLNLESTK